jgi:RTA1 like protein
MEVVGYIFRCLSSQQDPYSVPFFVVQYFFIVVAPVFFSAAIYTIITIMINRVGREYAPLPPKVILWIFITCDVIATVIQIAGSALIGVAYSKKKNPNTPNHILLAGLAFQVFSFAVFVVCLSVFLRTSRKVTSSDFKLFSSAVCVATLMVYLRTCLRLAETAEGLQQYLSTHEVFFGCLEFAPIVIAVYTFLYWHPGRWLGSKVRTEKCSEAQSSTESRQDGAEIGSA